MYGAYHKSQTILSNNAAAIRDFAQNIIKDLLGL